MFKTLLDFIKRVVNMIFKNDDIKRITGYDTVMSVVMADKIQYWLNMYRGEADWTDDYVKSLRLEQGICREFSDCVLSEIETSVSNDKLNAIYQKCLVMLNENLQAGLALGSFCLKPLGEDKAEFVTADKFVPIRFTTDGKLESVVFISTKQIKTDSIYRRFELHELTPQGLHISNRAYHSKAETDIGRECSLEEVPEWAGLTPDVLFLTDRMDFGYYRNPLKNEIDGTFCGVSIYDSAIDLIKKADVQFGRLEWEFESGERAINVDVSALQAQTTVGTDGKTTLALPKLNKRLYRGLGLAAGNNGEELYKEFSPAFREQNIINGLEQIKRAIEFNIGLAYGDLSDVQTVEKTATEIKHAKQRKYNRINAIETNLKSCLDDFVYGLAFYNKLSNSGYEFVCNFKDSILTDEETERNQDWKDISIGALPLWKYIMKWQGLTEEEAKAQAVETNVNTVME